MSQISLPKIYNPANQSPNELIDNFVVRTKIFNDIFNDIKESTMTHPEQHYIIQGMRGQGKTTLLLRLSYEINHDNKLNKWLIPIVFDEEEYSIRKLFKLWERIISYLQEHQGFEEIEDRLSDLSFTENNEYEEECYNLIINNLHSQKKKLILFIDNIGDILDRLTNRELQRFREILQQCNDIRIIGASSVSLEFHYDYKNPFYEFFKMPTLKGLTKEETKILMLNLGERYKRDRVQKILEEEPQRVEALRRITGGVIRTIILLFQIFIDDDTGDAFADLEKILDGVTPLYKHRMENLSPQQQEIVNAIALSWDAISTKEIAKKTKEKSKAISAQLKLLERNHLIEKQKTNTKNLLYRLSERFFNIWYLMRYGGKSDATKVRFLVEFLNEWCDREALNERAIKHLETLRNGSVNVEHAYYLTEALAQTSIDRGLQHQLYKESRGYLESCGSAFVNSITQSDLELKELALESFDNNKDVTTCIKKLGKIRCKDGNDLLQLGYFWGFHKHDSKKAIDYFKDAIQKGNLETYLYLANLYYTELKDYNEAKKCYLLAIENDIDSAYFNIAILYQDAFNDTLKAEKYYLLAIEKDIDEANFPLANMYREMGIYEEAKKYYLKALEFGVSEANFNLAYMLHIHLHDYDKAEYYYQEAMKLNIDNAFINCANLYANELSKYKEAERLYLASINKNVTGAEYNLAVLYHFKLKEFTEAEKYYLKAIDKSIEQAIFSLAHLYHLELNQKEKARTFYLIAIKNGHTPSLHLLGVLYHNEFKDYKNAEKYYLKAIEKKEYDSYFSLAYLYHYVYKDYQQAEYNYLKALKFDFAEANFYLALLYIGIEKYDRAEKYLLVSVELGLKDSEFVLAKLYSDRKEYKKAEQWYLLASKKGKEKSMNDLAWMYYTEKLDKVKALEYAEKQYHEKLDIYTVHTFSMILLWNDEIVKALEISKEFLNSDESYEKFPEDVRQFIMLLIAKKQYHSALKLFNENPYNLKDRFKPLYYALMYNMQDEYPNEYIKMGSELMQTVDEILEAHQQLAIDYK